MRDSLAWEVTRRKRSGGLEFIASGFRGMAPSANDPAIDVFKDEVLDRRQNRRKEFVLYPDGSITADVDESLAAHTSRGSDRPELRAARDEARAAKAEARAARKVEIDAAWRRKNDGGKG
jgi:hypothetical protein